jgi:two-component system, NtrC family, sensor histidine kinase KinB
MEEAPQTNLSLKSNETAQSSLELLYHISRELVTVLDLRTVLERVVYLSMQTTGAISGTIIVMDDSGRPIESAIIFGGEVHDQTTKRLRVTLEKGLAGWVVRNRQAALIPDTSQDERWMLQQYDLVEKTSPKSAVCAPLLVHEKLIGVMTLVHPKAGFFTPDHLALGQAIAAQAGIAVLNARLYQESQRQARVMTALAESAATITGSLNLEDVLNRILEQISQALSVEAVSLALSDADKKELVVKAATGWNRQNFVNLRFKIGQGIAGWVAREGRGVVVPDVKSDPRYDPETEQRTGLETRAIACAPLRYRGQVIGVLEAINPTAGQFDPDALLVLTGIGSLAGTAVRHAQLFERLQAAHQSYRELFDDSIDPILISDCDGKIVEANRQAALASSYDKATLCTMTIHQLHAIDQEQLGEGFRNLASPKTFSYESRLRTRLGRELPIQVYVRQIEIEGVTHIQWILRDITERKNLDTMRDDLISMIYHDLRSPLANVVSSLDVLESMLPDEEDPTLYSVLTIAQRSTERIQRLTNSLLDINRLEAGQSIASMQPADPLLLINEAIELAAPMIEGKNQKIEKDLPAELPLVSADAEMIRRVVTNLLENASKYTSQESLVRIGAQPVGDWLHIWVIDNGPGIPASEHERIFDKFTRLNNREKAKGMGLGLAYCRLAVQGHGGKIWVESEPGAGAKFSFTLPIIKDEILQT